VVLLAGLASAATTHSSAKKTHKSTGTKTKAGSTHSKAVASTHSKKSTAHLQSAKATGKHGHKTISKSKKVRGQQSIDGDRAREIQTALIREHYLDGEPTGSFDARTKSALVKFQQDNGWQTKVIPDSRALIKLGLGPSKDGLLNPESAAIAGSRELGPEREIPGGSISAQRK
jgi:peptidoglycan hydrolase-like protein with peptidoglycan-binding domain